MKPFTEDGFVRLDADWLYHLTHCQQCRGFDAQQPATAAAMCLEGSVLWKRDHTVKRKALPGERNPYLVSWDDARRATKHKELG